MTKRLDISKIMIIGSGPIIIGQACEFDYSGTQACRTLMNEGYDVILVNSNPATIMTDFEFANSTYIEPINKKTLSKIIEIERPDAILPTLGGQIALNVVLELSKIGIFKKFSIEIIGANLNSIKKAESRSKFIHAMNNIGLRVAKGGIASSLTEAIYIASKIGFPLIVRSSFTMGGSGSYIVENYKVFDELILAALRTSPTSQITIEESLIGWKEYEMELMRDCQDNVVVICGIENMDPIGIHTGDSITVAPIQTLTDKEYQNIRDAAIKVVREIGVETGGANVQFAVNPDTGEVIIIEMNPRVSRSSALASKATGYPIAKIATKLAIGYSLYEIYNDIIGKTVAFYEPSVDYCVVKIPVWDIDKFPGSDDYLTTMMRSVGETMAIGRTFKEAFQKAMRSIRIEIYGFGIDILKDSKIYGRLSNVDKIMNELYFATSQRLINIYCAFYFGVSIFFITKITGIDFWFIVQFYQFFEIEYFLIDFFNYRKNINILEWKKPKSYYKELLLKIKMMGFSDSQIARLLNMQENDLVRYRNIIDIKPIYKSVDTCSGEFYAKSPYYYSTYEVNCEVTLLPYHNKKVIILGSGPNRIGQGIEFDYCCVHASMALREEGIKSIMINSNPETISTDYDISDRLYFEPLSLEDIMNVIIIEKPIGVIVQFGGQIPLNLSKLLHRAGVKILGTQPVDIDYAENRELFRKLLIKIGLDFPNSAVVNSVNQAIVEAERIGYPVMIRPSYILGGKAINIARNRKSLIHFVQKALSVSFDYSILIDDFLQGAKEIDVDLICDGYSTLICGVIEHIEEAGIHSGDSAYVLPTRSISSMMIEHIKRMSRRVALELNIVGLINIQYAVMGDKLYVIEANPRASRTIPFISKVAGIPFSKIATEVILGKKLTQLDVALSTVFDYIAVKEAVFSFDRFLASNIGLNPEMKSTGEVMGIGFSFASAYIKAQFATEFVFSKFGKIFLITDSTNNNMITYLIKRFKKLGFDSIISCVDFDIDEYNSISKNIFNNSCVFENLIKNGDIKIILTVDINHRDIYKLGCDARRLAIKYKIPYISTFNGAIAMCDSLEFLFNKRDIKVNVFQNFLFL